MKRMKKASVNSSSLCFKARTKLGFTQLCMAKTFGVSQSTIQKWEGGTAKPNNLYRQILQRVIEVEPSDQFSLFCHYTQNRFLVTDSIFILRNLLEGITQ